MQILQNLDVARQLARERQASLQLTTGRGQHGVRRWLGRRLVGAGNWLANEQPMRTAVARQTSG